MQKGQLEAIYIAATAAAPMTAVDTARAVPGRGLEGDRYFNQKGTFLKPGPDREVTLIEIEALEALKREFGIALDSGASRRNLLTRDVSLNDLVARDFSVGPVLLRGIRLCEPCAHLEKLTQTGVVQGLVRRGGLRAQVLSEGVIRVGDAVYTKGNAI